MNLLRYLDILRLNSLLQLQGPEEISQDFVNDISGRNDELLLSGLELDL